MRLNETYRTEDLPQGNYEPLPVGWYAVTVSAAEIKDTKAGNGQYISLQLTVDGPTHEGRVVFHLLNIRNANPKAEEIGRRQLGDLLRAVGLASLSDTDELLGKSLRVKLGIEEGQAGYEPKNTVKICKSLTESEAPAPKKEEAKPETKQETKKASPPWAQKKQTNNGIPF